MKIFLCVNFFAKYNVQGVSENMQQLLSSTTSMFKPGRIKVRNQIRAYNHAIALIIKIPKNDT